MIEDSTFVHFTTSFGFLRGDKKKRGREEERERKRRTDLSDSRLPPIFREYITGFPPVLSILLTVHEAR
jgi:hypothetical protein